MKFLIKIIIWFSVPLIAFAQDDTPVMQYFVGGGMKLNINAGMNFGGAGIGTSTYGGIISSVATNGAASIFSNPADLANLQKAQISFNTRPPLSTGLVGMGKDDLITPDMIKEQTDGVLNEGGTFSFPAGNYRKDTQVNEFNLALTGGLSSFSVGLPIMDGLSIGLGYYNPLDYSLDLLVAGINTNLRTSRVVGNNETVIDMILNNSFSMNFNLKYNLFSVGAGYRVFDNEDMKLTTGFAINSYYMQNRFDLFFFTDGVMVLGNTKEYYFNDPNDANLNRDKGETNDLYWRAQGNFKNRSNGFKISSTFSLKNLDAFITGAHFTLVYDYVPQYHLVDDNASSVSYQPKFMTGRFGDSQNEIDFVVDSINLAKPNLTVQTDNVFAKSVNISLPSSITIGSDLTFDNFTLSFNILKYMGELSYEFDKYKIGLTSSVGIKVGWDLRCADKIEDSNIFLLPLRILFLDFDGILLQAFRETTGYRNPHYRFGGGLMFGDPIVTGFPDDQIKSMKDALSFGMLTGISMGRQYTILNNVHIGVMLFGFPDVALKYSIAVGI